VTRHISGEDRASGLLPADRREDEDRRRHLEGAVRERQAPRVGQPNVDAGRRGGSECDSIGDRIDAGPAIRRPALVEEPGQIAPMAAADVR
jgi:hypothetical protein